ncbi:MAG TPA: tetratricopeptide repeat protein [Cytophagaceae bacterium]
MRTLIQKYIYFFICIHVLIPILSFLSFIIYQSAEAATPLDDGQPNIEILKKEADKSIQDGDNARAAELFYKIAFIYWNNNDLEESIQYFSESIKLNEQAGNIKSMAIASSNLGMIYSEMMDYESSISYFEKSILLKKLINDNDGIVSELLNQAMVMNSFEKYDDAIKSLEEALSIAKEFSDSKIIRIVYQLLGQNYEKTGNMQRSIDCYNYASIIDKQIQKEAYLLKEVQAKLELERMENKNRESEKARLIKELELIQERERRKSTEDSLHEAEKLNRERTLQIELLNQEKKLKELTIKDQQAALENQRFKMLVMIGFSVLVVIFGIYFIISYRRKIRDHQLLKIQAEEIKAKSIELEKAFEKIKDQNNKITSSINYAQRIQKAMLPPADSLMAHLPESFILFKPRDIVSGDFYWFAAPDTDTNNESYQDVNLLGNDDDFIITASDCTGHGVPGALMSMIGFNLLNEITKRGIKDTHLILQELHKGIRAALKQDTTDNKDGMDIAICRVSKTNKTVQFSGAKNPIYYIQNGELTHIKGDSHPIGGKEQERVFTNHIIPIVGPTTFYLFSDGYADQFGGNEGRKFMYSRFKQLLLQIHQEPMQKQRKILDQTIEDWKSDVHKQIDDILVIGFKIE